VPPGLPKPRKGLPIVSPGSPAPLAGGASRGDSTRLAAFDSEPVEGGR
jgi:hypothetical protein